MKWEEKWERNIRDIRRELNLPEAPLGVSHLSKSGKAARTDAGRRQPYAGPYAGPLDGHQTRPHSDAGARLTSLFHLTHQTSSP
jgi:hypothetical protein